MLSGLLYQWHGLVACLWASVGLVLAAGALSLLLPTEPERYNAAPPSASSVAPVT